MEKMGRNRRETEGKGLGYYLEIKNRYEESFETSGDEQETKNEPRSGNNKRKEGRKDKY